jgi:SapC
MATIRVVSWQEHGNCSWQPPQQYVFAAQDQVAALAMFEVPAAMRVLPLAFIKTEGGYATVALQGFKTSGNILLAADGSWRAEYVPHVYRHYPFKLAKDTNQQFVLCLYEDSQVVKEGYSGVRLFDDDKKPSKALATVFNELLRYEQETGAMLQASHLLQELNLFEPWKLQVQIGDKEETQEGLYRINESKLNTLDAESLLALRNSGALMLCYAQLFSMQNIQQLAKVQTLKAGASQQESKSAIAGMSLLDNNDMISFANI